MDPVWTLFATLVILHFVEGLVWVRRDAVVVRRRGRRFVVDAVDGGFGNERGRFVLLPSLPPFDGVYVVEPWPLLGDETGFSPRSIETWRPPRASAPRGAAPQDPVRRDGKELSAGPLRVELGSRTRARQVEAWMKRSAGWPAEKAARAWLTETHDAGAIARRQEALRRWTARLGWACPLYGLVLFAGTWAFFRSAAFRPHWPLWLILLGALWLFIGVEFFVAHRRLYPEDRGHRWTLMALLLLSPPAPIRARQWLALDALARHHPLPLALALVEDDQERARFAEWVARRLNHPLGDATPGLEAARREVWQAHARSARALVEPLDLAALADGPPADLETARAFCPRCGSSFDTVGECPDCPGIRRRLAPS